MTKEQIASMYPGLAPEKLDKAVALYTAAQPLKEALAAHSSESNRPGLLNQWSQLMFSAVQML